MPNFSEQITSLSIIDKLGNLTPVVYKNKNSINFRLSWIFLNVSMQNNAYTLQIEITNENHETVFEGNTTIEINENSYAFKDFTHHKHKAYPYITSFEILKKTSAFKNLQINKIYRLRMKLTNSNHTQDIYFLLKSL